MADKKYLPYIIDKFYWWQSEDEFLSNWSDFAYSENMDMYLSPKSICVSKQFAQITIALTSNITKILRLPNDIQSNAYFTADGKVYIDSGSWPVLVHTLTISDKVILNAICFTNYVLFFTSWAIHKIAFTGDDFKTFASCTENLLSFTGSYKWFSANESKDLVLYNYKDSLLYLWAWNKLFSIGNTLSAVSLSETYRIWSKIVWMSFLNSNLKVYINYMNVNGILHFWNEASSDSLVYKNRVFKAITTDWQLDYVVCADWLYIYNGFSGEKLFDYNFNDFGKSWSWYFVPQNLLCIDPYYWYVAYNKNIFKFWKKFTNLPNWFSLYWKESNNITAISDELTINWSLTYWCDVPSAYIVSPSVYKATWYMEWIVFYWDTMEKIKKVDRVFIAYSIPAWWKIEIYLSVDWQSYPASPNITIDNSSVKWKELFANELNNLTFHWIKPKIVFTNPSPYSTSWKMYEFSMFSEYIQNI